MKKRLSLILAMIMILATATTIFASVGVNAAYADSTVAVIGDTEYDDLQPPLTRHGTATRLRSSKT